jgi:hypothetical protein
MSVEVVIRMPSNNINLAKEKHTNNKNNTRRETFIKLLKGILMILIAIRSFFVNHKDE